MVWESKSLNTRLYRRRQWAVPVRIQVHPDQAEQLRFSFPNEQSKASLDDVSEGGMGLFTTTFLPRNARLEVHVSLPAKDNSPAPAPKVFRTVVRRCTMVDVQPTYQIGLQYIDPDRKEVADLIKLAENTADQPDDEPPKGGPA